MSSSDLPVPYGWTQEFDPKTNHPFWVDTKVDPPRAIWTHPYDDEQYLREHPEVREKVESLDMKQRDSKDSPPSKARRHSFNGHDSATMVPETDEDAEDSSKKGKGKRGFFGKLKDKAIGTKEEREAHRKEQARLDVERQRQYTEMINAQRAEYAQEQALYDQRYRAGPSCRRSGPQRYGPPPGDPYMYGPEYGRGYGYGGYGGYEGYGDYSRGRGCRRRNNGLGGGGLPLLGALAGGLLLGDILF